MNISNLNRLLGNIDIYLLDLILKGHYQPDQPILDAGCGEGRNLIYFLQQQFNVKAIDQHEAAIKMLQFTIRSINSQLDPSLAQVGQIQELPYPDHSFTHIICSAVLHFSINLEDFKNQIDALHRVLQPGGTLFIRMAALQGMESQTIPVGNGRYKLPDHSERFLLTPELLDHLQSHYQWQLIQPAKFVVVEQQRSMSTLLFQKFPGNQPN